MHPAVFQTCACHDVTAEVIPEVKQQRKPRQRLPIYGKSGREVSARVPDQHPWLPPVVST